MWIDLFVSHINDHKKVTTEEIDFNNQMDSMTNYVDCSQTFSSANPVIVHELMNKVTMITGHACTQQNELPLTKTDMTEDTVEYTSNKDPHCVLIMTPSSGIISIGSGCRLVTLDHFSVGHELWMSISMIPTQTPHPSNADPLLPNTEKIIIRTEHDSM